MKKKLVSSLLAVSMIMSTLAGCGNSSAPATNNDGAATENKTEATADTTAEATVDAADEGKVLNIYVWNEEFKSRVTDFYPGYEEVDATHGKIGDIDVVWNITPSDDNAYQNNLDATLMKQADAPAACLQIITRTLFGMYRSARAGTAMVAVSGARMWVTFALWNTAKSWQMPFLCILIIYLFPNIELCVKN